MDKVLIIDGLHAINRANIQFGAPKIKPLSWDDKQTNNEPKINNSIVYTFFRMLRSMVEEFAPNKPPFFCLEGNNNFRYGLFPEYKANRIIKTGSGLPEDAVSDEKLAKRIAAKEDFNRQRDIIIPLLRHLPIQVINANRFEADDVIATLAESIKDEDTTIISGDSDLIQILQQGYKHTKLYNPIKKVYVEPPDYHYVAWKSLRGDTSDNIPSVAGPKKTEKLLANPKLLEEFLSDTETRAAFNLNKELIELRIIPDDQLIFADYNVNYDALREEFARLELPTMIEGGYWNRFVETFRQLEGG
jgi:5'-3' exonuclease